MRGVEDVWAAGDWGFEDHQGTGVRAVVGVLRCVKVSRVLELLGVGGVEGVRGC